MDKPPSEQPSPAFGALVRRIIHNRWMVVVATFFIMACSGATYNFGLYSNEMKLSLYYNQETVTTIGFFKDLGANVGIFSGLLYDLTGPWLVLMCGAILNIFGYLMIWLAVTHRIPTPKLWQMCLYICIGANSQAFTNTGVIVTSVKNFPHNRGLVIGLLKGFVGLSGAMLTLVYHALYGNSPSSFILLIAWLPCAVCLMFMLVIRRLPPAGPEGAKSEKKIFSLFLVIALVLAGYLMIVIIIQNYLPRAGSVVLATLMLFIVISPIGVVIRQELKTTTDSKGHTDVNVRDETVEAEKPTTESVELADIEGENAIKRDSQSQPDPTKGELQPYQPPNWSWPRVRRLIWERPPRGSDYTIPEAVFSIDMLTIFIATTCGVGGGLMAIDNMGQIGDSLGYKHREVSTFVSLISIWNFLGRVSSGYVSEMALQRFGVPRTFFFALVMGIAAIGHIVIALALPGALYAGSIILGLTFGAQWALMYIIISEIFGLKYYGTLYNVGGVASPLGSYLLSVRVAGTLYDKEAAKDSRRMGKFVLRILGEGSSQTICHGSHCYRLTFFIMAAVCLSGALVALVLTFRTRKFYREIHLRMKQHKEQMAPVQL